jgi:hypothetical protein
MPEHDQAVRNARAHLAAKAGPPLEALPADFADARATLHRVAEDVLKPKRQLETGNEIALGFTPNGFGTPAWERGNDSGTSGLIRVEGAEIVTVEGDSETRHPIAGVETAAAAALADWFAFGTVVLAELLSQHPDSDVAPIRLWPEHFDVASELGAEAVGHRATYGASPGDEEHSEPYLYVGPWDRSISGDLWNATSFFGAELGHRDLLAADDQIAAALGFMGSRVLF